MLSARLGFPGMFAQRLRRRSKWRRTGVAEYKPSCLKALSNQQCSKRREGYYKAKYAPDSFDIRAVARMLIDD